MKPPEQVKREFVAQWLARAREDMKAAEILSGPDASAWAAAAFHAQQAAEKYLKALLVEHQIEFARTHDLGQLLDLLASRSLSLAESLRGAEALSMYAVEARYPGDWLQPGRAEADDALEIARQVEKAVLSALPDAA
jgi:HEPN domain-containing protein